MFRAQSLPDVVSGYELNRVRGYISVVLPIGRTNLILNPSFETNTTGYTAIDGAVLTRTTSQQRYGAWSLQIKPSLAGTAGTFYTTSALVAGNTYAFSFFIFARGGRRYQARVFDGARSLLTRPIIGKGYWERVSVLFTAITNGAHRLYLEKDGNANTDVLFTDAWQLELCETDNYWPTTYIDGDQDGYVSNQIPPAYYWTGVPHASTSVRDGQTRSGGRVVNLKDYGFRLLAMIGLGMAPIVNSAIPNGLIGGAQYQRTVPNSRQFSLVGSVLADNFPQLERQRRDIQDAVKPDLIGTQQPMLMHYQYTDCDNPTGEVMEIVCNYESGLGGNNDNLTQERLSLAFTMFDPYIVSQGENAALLNYAQNITGGTFASVVSLASNGAWSGLNFTPLLDPSAMIVVNGDLYVGGAVAVGGSMYKYSNGAFTNLNIVLTGTGGIRAFALAPDGVTLYVAGGFSTVNGNAAVGLFSYNTLTGVITSLNTGGFTAGDGIHDLVVGSDGTIYVCGQFSTIGGVTVNGIAKRSPGGVWGALTGGIGINAASTAYGLRIGSDGYLYMVGAFGAVDGVSFARVARFNISTAVWSGLGSGLNGTAFSLDIGQNGVLYVGGSFTTAGGISANNIAAWNGAGWTPLGPGVLGGSQPIAKLVVDTLGNVYVGGSLTSAGGSNLPSCLAVWNGSVWIPLGISFPGTETLYTITFDKESQNVFFSTTSTGSDSVAYANSVTYNGKAITSPKFVINGPGVLWQIINNTTGRRLFFNNLTLLNGEQLTIITKAGKLSVSSNFRGNLIGKVSPASDLANFILQPGLNSISVFLETAGANTLVEMIWKNAQWDIASSIRY